MDDSFQQAFDKLVSAISNSKDYTEAAQSQVQFLELSKNKSLATPENLNKVFEGILNNKSAGVRKIFYGAASSLIKNNCSLANKDMLLKLMELRGKEDAGSKTKEACEKLMQAIDMALQGLAKPRPIGNILVELRRKEKIPPPPASEATREVLQKARMAARIRH